MAESSPLLNQALIAYEKLAASDVPKYTKRRNYFVLHDMLERFGERTSRHGQDFHTEWYYLQDGDNMIKEAHFFHEGRFACEADLHETAKSRGIATNRNRRCSICEAYARGLGNVDGYVIKIVWNLEHHIPNVSMSSTQSD